MIRFPGFPFSSVLRNKCQSGLLIGVLVFLALLFGCRTKTVKTPAPKPKFNYEALKYIDIGDKSFLSRHLYGWRQAQELYQKAYDLAGSEPVKTKLLLTQFLVLIRQFDEGIPYPKAGEVIQALNAGDANQRVLAEIAEWYRNNKAGSPPDIKSIPIIMGEDPALEAYLNLLLSGSIPEGKSLGELQTLAGQFRESPLFLYLGFGKLKPGDLAQLEKDFPQFAEAFEYFAESFFQKKQYRGARTYFQKAIALVPDYTRAINGLGNFYFFALEDYEQSLSYYESTLKWDPSNTAAWFGKGASLHRQGRYGESNAALDAMYDRDFFKSNRANAASYSYYSGEGRYLKAYNHHLMKDPVKARELVNAARQFLPDSEEINDLSGMLHFQAQQYEEARKDFLKVLSKGNGNCSAQMHLGLIYQQLKQPDRVSPSQEQIGKGLKEYRENWSPMEESAEQKTLNYFLGASACMQDLILDQANQIASVASLDLDPNEKILLEGRLRKKLADSRVTSSSMMEMMIDALSEESIANKDNYVGLMKKILTRIRTP
jgi:tetratricopeptide (TPR) repeat protein